MELKKLEENLKYALDRYGEFVDRKELLKIEKQKIINSILTPEQLAEIEDVEFEFEVKEKKLEDGQKESRKYLDIILRQYAEAVDLLQDEKRIIKGNFAKVSLEEGDVVYDSDAMDEYAIKHPEVLEFRKQNKKKTRITLNTDIQYTKE